MPKRETLIELVERLDEVHGRERDEYFYDLVEVLWPRISKAVRELRRALNILAEHETEVGPSGITIKLGPGAVSIRRLLARLDEGEVEG